MTAPSPLRVPATALLLCALAASAGCTGPRRVPPDPARAAAALCEGQVPADVTTIQRGRVVPGLAVRGDLLRGDSAGVRRLGEEVWVYTATHDGPATVRIDLPRPDVWLTTRILYGTRGFDQLGVAGGSAESGVTHRMTFRAQPGRCYAFHLHSPREDTTSLPTAYTLQVDVGAPVQPIRMGQTVDASLGGGDQSRVQANESRIYYFEDWVIEDAGTDSLRVRMEAADAAGEGGTLAVGTADLRDGAFTEIRRVGGTRPEIVFLPEPGRRYLLRAEMSHAVMDPRYRLTVERVAPPAP